MSANRLPMPPSPVPPDRFTALDDPDELDQVARPTSLDADSPMETVLAIDGIHCAACAIAIEQALAGRVDTIEVNIGSRRARLVWRQDRQRLSSLLRSIAELRYDPRPIPLDALDRADVGRRRSALWRMLVALFCMMQVMMYAVPRYVAGDTMPPDILRLLLWSEAMLTLPVLLFAAGPFFGAAWRDLLARRIGMDLPVALGIAVTFGASLAGFVLGDAHAGDVYFDSVSMFVALLLVARWLETRARERAFGGLADSLARLPQLVVRRLPDGRSESVSRRRLQAGDLIVVPAGESIGADGVVAQGRSSVDESLITGESRAIARGPGDAVVGGSINLAQPLVVRVTAASNRSRLAELHLLVERAASSKPSLMRTADRWAGPFLFGILAVAALTALAWYRIDPARAPWVAAAVLIVTCPCAFALAAPSALLAAMGSLARKGTLIGRSDTLEALAQASVAVFDKTGTLTTDRPSLHCIGLEGITEADALRLGAALERASIHPVAKALVRAAPAETAAIEARGVTELAGGGVGGELLLDGRWVAASVRPEGDLIRIAAGGRSAAFQLRETLRPDAAATMQRLRDLGLRCLIASGDTPDRVASVAERCRIDAPQSACSPERKLALVRSLQAGGERVLMIGDGVNDAAVLGQADASVSFLHAAPLAQHQADVLLLGTRLQSIATTIATARRAMRIVRQSFGFAVVYNLVGIPLAIAGLLPPWLAGLGMAASSLIVVANALRAQTAPADEELTELRWTYSSR